MNNIKELIEERVTPFLPRTKAIAFDGCHKIYLALDAEQVRTFKSYGYGEDDDGSVLIHTVLMPPEKVLEQLTEWFEKGCGLEFINAVEGNDVFHGIIEQFDDGIEWDEEGEF